MKRFPILGVLLLIPALALFGVIGCTNKKEDGSKDGAAKDGAKEKGKDGATAKGAAEEITTVTDGTVKGVVIFDGTPPKQEVNKAIAAHKEGPACMKGSPIDVQEQTWIVNKDGAVANVVISLAPPKGKKYKVTDALKEPFKEAVIVDQPFCAYRPHVVGVLSGVQPIIWKNHFENNHNVKVDGGPLNGVFNEIITPKDVKSKPLILKGGENVYNVTCEMHGFMTGKIAVFPHPYFSVSKEDGSFEIKNVPTDTELTVYTWHEAHPEKAVAEKITLKKGETKELKLKIK
jgi:plastocyanin